jgi:arylsulfatase A-like enzyme
MASAERDGPPNVVQILVDDLGWTDVGYQHHHQEYDTPTLDRLAGEGMAFTSAYAASPTRSPSRAAFQTGQHPARHRLVRHIPSSSFGDDGRPDAPFHEIPDGAGGVESRNWLPREATTVADTLGGLGYHCAFFGKWHLGHEPYHPTEQGYDEQHGVSNFGHPGSYYPPYWETGNPYEDAPEGTHLTERLVDDVVRFVETHEGDEPFLASLATYAVHTPVGAPEALCEKYRDRGLPEERAAYAALVELTDRQVGRVLDALAERGIAEETMVVVCGDQGGNFTNAPLRGGKPRGEALYEGGARVPMVVRWPGRVRGGTRTDETVSTVDVVPTIVEAAGGDPLANEIDGVSLRPVLEAESALGREAVVLYRRYGQPYAAVLASGWKLVAREDGDHELFDLDADPTESRDLSAERPAKVDQLLAVLDTWKEETGVAEWE